MKPYRAAIKWVDIAEHGGETWQKAKKVRPKPHIVSTTCWVIYEDGEYVVGAMDLGVDGRASGLATYPKGCIRSIEVLS